MNKALKRLDRGTIKAFFIFKLLKIDNTVDAFWVKIIYNIGRVHRFLLGGEKRSVIKKRKI